MTSDPEHLLMCWLLVYLGKCLFKRHLFKAEYGSTYVSSQHSEQILFLLFGDYLIGVDIPCEICIVQSSVNMSRWAVSQCLPLMCL